MQLTGEELTAFLDERKSRIAALAAPTGVEAALAEIHERIGKQLPVVPNQKSLESLVDIAATDIALRPLYTDYCADNPDDETVRKLFDWRESLLEAEMLKTIRFQLLSSDAVKMVMADAMVALWDSRKTFDPRKGWFVPWARRIALNKARSYRPFKWEEISIDTSRDRPVDLPSSGPSPEDAAVAHERAGDIGGPPPEGYVEVLRLVQDFEPREVIAFLFNRYLDIMPAQIAARIRESFLSDALADAIALIRTRYPEIAGIDAVLAPLAGRLSGIAEKFGHYAGGSGTLEKDIGRWAEKVHRAVGGTILQMGKSFLRFVCDLSAAAHEIVCFLWIRFLYSPPIALRRVEDRELMYLVEIFHEDYSRRELLSLPQVESCTGPVRKRISPEWSLSVFAGADLYASIRRWCDHIDLLIAGGVSAERMLGYAYITGSLTKGKSR